METSTHEKTQIEPHSHPFYFAHYLNMARHNAYVILSTIAYELNFTEGEIEENNLQQLKLYNNKYWKDKPDEQALRNEMLLSHFPFLREIKDEATPNNAYEQITDKLKDALTLLNNLRNNFSHFPFDNRCTASIELSPYFTMALKKAQKRMSPYFHENDFSLMNNDENGIYQLQKNGTLSLKGLCFFTCFFLEKKYAFQFLAGIHGFKDTRENKYRATLEVFTENCCRLPYPKLESSDFKLDIINELSRCPDALFKVLDKKNQEKFITNINISPGDVPDKEPEDEEEKQKIIMKRHRDRFPYFALRYFDESNILDGISFHVHLGKWIKSMHEKRIIIERDRLILRDVRAYGEPYKFNNDFLPEYWDINQFEQYAPAYRFAGNRIGITLKKGLRNKWPKLTRNTKPDAIISTYELPNLFVYAYLYKQKQIEVPPADYIQKYIDNINNCISDVQKKKILPAGKFTLEKNRNQQENSQLNNRKEKLELLLHKKYSLKLSDLPDDIKYYLLGYKMKSQKKQAKLFFKNMDRKTKYNLNRIEKLRVGDMAQILADDIMFLTPPFIHVKDAKEHKQKLNDKEYDILQKALAYYSTNKNILDELFKNHKAFNGEKKHPFLNRINISEQRGIYDFYKAYFLEKERWLVKLTNWFNSKSFSEKELFSQYDYLIKTDKKIAEKQYNQLPGYLPRGIFNEPVLQALKNKGFPIKHRDNVAYAINLMVKENTQQFYKTERFYNKNQQMLETFSPNEQPAELMDKIKKKLECLEKEKEEDEYKKYHFCKKDISESEKEIRYNQQTDQVLWMMLKDIFPEGEKINNNELTTLDFNNNEENNILNKAYEVSETIYDKYCITDCLPAKRYGEFRKFLKDRRLENLLKYYNSDNKIPREKLVHELENYDLKRKEILELIYNFEKIVHTKYQTEEIINSLGENNLKKYEDTGIISHSGYLEFICEKFNYELPLKGAEEYSFAVFRNKLLHNQIPYNAQLADFVNNADNYETLVTQKLFDIIINVYTNLIETIKNE
jgi:hypothetical protein